MSMGGFFPELAPPLNMTSQGMPVQPAQGVLSCKAAGSKEIIYVGWATSGLNPVWGKLGPSVTQGLVWVCLGEVWATGGPGLP